MGLLFAIPQDDAKVVKLRACPSCSRPAPAPDPSLTRPTLVTGRQSGKIFIAGCCAFSGVSRTAYDDPYSAIAAWTRYRVKAAEMLAARGNTTILPRLKAVDEEEGFCNALSINPTGELL